MLSVMVGPIEWVGISEQRHQGQEGEQKREKSTLPKHGRFKWVSREARKRENENRRTLVNEGERTKEKTREAVASLEGQEVRAKCHMICLATQWTRGECGGSLCGRTLVKSLSL